MDSINLDPQPKLRMWSFNYILPGSVGNLNGGEILCSVVVIFRPSTSQL